jgi:hypothetical protein
MFLIFVIYILSKSYSFMDRMTVELKRIWKEAVVSQSRHLPAVGLEEPRVSAQNVNQDSGCIIRHGSIAKKKYKASALQKH